MRALILGGNGFIGAHIPAALAAVGHEGLTLARTQGDVLADRADVAAIVGAVRDLRIDVVIDMIAYEAAATTPLFDALKDRIARYVLISSCDVYANYGGLHRLETPPVTDPLTETAPRRTRLHPYRQEPPRPAGDPDSWRDRYDKIPVEDAIASPTTTILRLPMVYGRGDPNQRFAWMARPMLERASKLAAPAAWLDWRTTYGHVQDIAHAVALCASHSAAAGGAYHCGEPPCAHRDWIARFAALLNWTGEIEADEAGPLAKRLAALDLSYPLALDTRRIREELGYAETRAGPAALRDALSDIVANPDRRGP